MPENASLDVRRAQRRATYDFNVAHAALARRVQAEYGRWCLTALLLVHAGALLFTAVDGADGPWNARWWAAGGLTFTLLAGLMAWANWTLSAIVHTEWADDRLLDPQDTSPVDGPRLKKRIANLTWLLAMVFAAAATAAAPVALCRLGGG